MGSSSNSYQGHHTDSTTNVWRNNTHNQDTETVININNNKSDEHTGTSVSGSRHAMTGTKNHGSLCIGPTCQ